jgi:hypothetical protein
MLSMEEEEGGIRILPIVLGVLGVAALAGILYLKAGKQQMVPAPTSFVKYSAADKSFACQAPAEWQSAGMASHGVAGGALFKKGPAKIDITADLAGSLMGDVATSQNAAAAGLAEVAPGLAAALSKPPVEKVHEADKARMAAKYKEYEEGQMKPFRSAAGEARYSEWTANGGFGKGKLHGYRVTILGSERRIAIICEAPEGSWQNLKPAFEKVIGSMSPGTGG